MSDLVKILKSSFGLLLEQPRIFVPKLISAVIGAIAVTAIFFSGSSIAALTIAALTLPLLLVFGTFTPVMTAAMVKLGDEKQILRKGFTETLENWKGLFAVFGIGIAVMAINFIIYSAGIIGTYFTGSISPLIVALAINLCIILASGFYLYFLPVAVLDDQKTIGSIRSAFKASKRNRNEVIILMAFSFVVLIASTLTTGYLRKLGVALFFIGRMSSSIVGTYLLVISPNYYLSEGNNEN